MQQVYLCKKVILEYDAVSVTGDPFKDIVYPKQLEKVFTISKFTNEQQPLIQKAIEEIANPTSLEDKHDINVIYVRCLINLLFTESFVPEARWNTNEK